MKDVMCLVECAPKCPAHSAVVGLNGTRRLIDIVISLKTLLEMDFYHICGCCHPLVIP